MLKPIPSAPDYFADQDGYIWSTKAGRWGRLSSLPRKRSLKPDKSGYLCVVVYATTPDGRVKKSNKRVATLVAEAFHGPRPEGMSIGHLNGVRDDNRPENLSYCTYEVQALHKEQHGTMVRGDKSHMSIYSDKIWLEILSRLSAGESQRGLSREFGPSISSIHAVKTGQMRRHLTMDTTQKIKRAA